MFDNDDINAIELKAVPTFNIMICYVSFAVVVIEVTFFKTTYSVSAPHAGMRYSGRER